MTQEQIDALTRRINSASHKIQTAIAAEMMYAEEKSQRHPPTEAKHLRTGINLALAGNAALAQLLMDKGIFTHEEYLTAVAVAHEKEVLRCEAELTKLFGKTVTLG
jgi:predicted alternative tryptophan synthase beta-subunit